MLTEKAQPGMVLNHRVANVSTQLVLLELYMVSLLAIISIDVCLYFCFVCVFVSVVVVVEAGF